MANKGKNYGDFHVTGDVHLLVNGEKIRLGSGAEIAIYYNGTDLIVDAAEVGSGILRSKTDVAVTAGKKYIFDGE